MTSFERWIIDMASAIADNKALERGVDLPLEQRIAVAVVQARAAEARAIAGRLQIGADLRNNPQLMTMWQWLRGREDKLDNFAIFLSEPGRYPPDTPEPEKKSMLEVN